jgi:hypothetical protein
VSSFAAGKYYLALLDTVTDGIATVTLIVGDDSTSKAVSSTSSKLLYVKFAPTTGNSRYFRCYNYSPIGAIGWVQFDGARLYEITQAEYNAIDTMTEAQVAAKFPYVDSVQFKKDVMVEVKGKNLFDGDFPNIGYYTNSTGGLTAQADRKTTGYITVKSSTVFNLSSDFSLDRINSYDENYNFISSISAGSALSYSFLTPTNTKYIRFTVRTAGATIVQLELGSTASTYEPQVKTSAHTSIPLASDESVYVVPGAAVYKQSWAKNIQLSGSINWVYVSDSIGFKRVGTSDYTSSVSTIIASKYNGTFLINNATNSASDQVFFHSTAMFLNITVADADTGWTESMTPTTQEIQAYFYGWRMCASDGSTYVSGTKYWGKITDGTGITSTLPTATYTGFTPYTLHYKLTTPVYYLDTYNATSILSSGSTISVPTGIDQIEQRTGIAWPGKTDQANKYSLTVDVGIQVDNPSIQPVYSYQQQFNEQNVGYFKFTGIVTAPFLALNRQARSFSL